MIGLQVTLRGTNEAIDKARMELDELVGPGSGMGRPQGGGGPGGFGGGGGGAGASITIPSQVRRYTCFSYSCCPITTFGYSCHVISYLRQAII